VATGQCPDAMPFLSMISFKGRILSLPPRSGSRPPGIPADDGMWSQSRAVGSLSHRPLSVCRVNDHPSAVGAPARRSLAPRLPPGRRSSARSDPGPGRFGGRKWLRQFTELWETLPRRLPASGAGQAPPESAACTTCRTRQRSASPAQGLLTSAAGSLPPVAAQSTRAWELSPIASEEMLLKVCMSQVMAHT
jgi:hypothetical protein